MPMYPFQCPKCEEEFDVVLSISDYDKESSWDCIQCEGVVTKDDRIICAANVTRASYVDGTKRKGFAERKEALKLKKESYNMKPEDRKEIRKTIKQIERSTDK
jgi:putative FmdB family regulatory protein